MHRKLTTILYADGVGFAAGMERDETGALARLQRRLALMREAFARHGGRQVNTWGDAVIAEFESVVEAIRCAVEIQEAIDGENAGLPDDERMRFRIGVNLGDVMVEEGDVYGDGVNLAARLQELAEPGGVVVSAGAREVAHRQLALTFEALGPRRVKSLESPVEGYRISGPGLRFAQARPAAPTPAPPDAAPLSARVRAALSAQSFWVKVAVAMIAFFFAVNLLFADIRNPWFIFPSAPFAFFAALRWRAPAPPAGP